MIPEPPPGRCGRGVASGAWGRGGIESPTLGLKVSVESLQADARKGNSLHIDAFRAATSCWELHHSEASPYSRDALAQSSLSTFRTSQSRLSRPDTFPPVNVRGCRSCGDNQTWWRKSLSKLFFAATG